METIEERYKKIRTQCWDKSLNCFGMGYIFDKKAQRFGFYINLLKVFGLAVPSTIGATVLAYGVDSPILKWIILIAVPLTIIQFLFSLLAVIYKWDDELAYAFEASQDLSLLYDDFKRLANFPPERYGDLDRNYELLNTKYKFRTQQNSKHNIREWELRKGMRFGLREFQRKCKGCQNIPTSMESTDCNICGKFSRANQFKLFKT